MKRKRILIALLIGISVLAAAAYATRSLWCRFLPIHTQAGKAGLGRAASKQCKTVYVCPMHHQIIKDKPGDCPICGMTLIKEEVAPQPQGGGAQGGTEGMPGMEKGMSAGAPRVTLDPRQIALANVATTKVVFGDLSEDIETVGRVAVNEQSLRMVTARYGGRIERLAVNFTGQPVRKGQLIMSIYSPELLSTQKEYLIAKQSSARLASSGFPEIAKGSEGVLDAARTRMRLWGMTDAQIKTLDRTGSANPVVNVYSPVSGTVMDVKARQGDYVSEGSQIYNLADLSRVWVFAEVYEYEFSKVGMGSSVEVTADAFPGRVFRGRVSFIEPTVDPQSRTVKVRVDLPNPGGLLKPDMFVDARIFSKPVHGLMVPASAILYTGNHNYAWVEIQPGEFERREVGLGMRSGDNYQALSGLKEGEMVVSQGGFLVDSEAQLRESAAGGMAGMPGMDMGKKKAPAPETAPPQEKSKGMPGMPGM